MKGNVWIRLSVVCGIVCGALAADIPRLEKRGAAT